MVGRNPPALDAPRTTMIRNPSGLCYNYNRSSKRSSKSKKSTTSSLKKLIKNTPKGTRYDR